MLVLDDLKELVDRRTGLDRPEDLFGRMSLINRFLQKPSSFPVIVAYNVTEMTAYAP